MIVVIGKLTCLQGDERLRTFPFPTRRPTQSELLRCLLELTRVKVSHLTEDALRAQDEAYLASLPKPKAAPAAPAAAPAPQPKLTPEEIAKREAERVSREKWTRILDMLDRGRLDTAKTFWARETAAMGGIDARILDGVESGAAGRTLLMVAARKGQEDVVRWLKEQLDDAIRARGTREDVMLDMKHILDSGIGSAQLNGVSNFIGVSGRR